MPASASFITYVLDLFAPFGEISVKKMFGGAGIYCDGMFFAIIGDDDLWFKVDDVNRAAFEGAGSAPFYIEMKNGQSGTMSYYNPPEEIFDDADALKEWTTLALDAASRAAKLKKPKKKAAKKKTAKKKARKKAKKK